MKLKIATALTALLLTTAGVVPAVAAGGQTPTGSLDLAPASTVGGAAGADAPRSADNETTVTLLTYNDIQTAAAKTGNLPRLATGIERRRQAHDNPVVVVGGGDQVSPHALSPVSQWKAPIAALNRIDPAADVVGNHDLDYGFDAVRNYSSASKFPWLVANVVNESTGDVVAGAKPYTVVERNGVKVGLIGLVDGAIKSKTSVDFDRQGYEVTDFATVGPRIAERLKEERNVDVVVALAHIGVPESKELARADDGAIDAVVTGDDEIYYPPQETSDTVIVEGKARARYLGELNLTVSGGEVTDWSGRLVNTSRYAKHEGVSSTISEYRSEVSLDSTVATSEVKLDARFSTNYHRESNYGNLVADAMRASTGADLAITNAGGIRSNAQYGPGDITGGDVFNTLPFANTVVVLNMTGAEVRDALESQVVTLGSEIGQQYGAEISQQVSGVSFEWIPHEGRERHITDVYVGGEPLDPDAHYEVAVNSYIAGGGSSYPLADEPRVNRTGTLLATTVVNYLERKGSVAPKVVGRMRRVTSVQDGGPLALDGLGLAVLRVRAPPHAVSLDNESWRATSPGTTGTVEPIFRVRSASTGMIRLYFQDDQLRQLATDGNGQIDVYADYTDERYQWVYWDTAVLSVDTDTDVRPNPLLTLPWTDN